MSSAPPHAPPPTLDPLAAVLSYLLPGLGQVLQGRIGKGILYFVCIYGLFFYGMWLGQMRNVWLPDTERLPPVELPIVGKTSGVLKTLSYRPQFLGQFWIGVAAWPAVVQYTSAAPPADAEEAPKGAPVIGSYMRAPSETELNKLQRDGDKRWDLGWVYTVIAGVLNILVIYDALAGPMFRDEPKKAADAAAANANTAVPGAPPRESTAEANPA